MSRQANGQLGRRGSRFRHPRRAWRVTAGLAAIVAVSVLGPGSGVLAADPGHRAFGDVTVFASAPAPGPPVRHRGRRRPRSTSRRAPATSSPATRTPTTSGSSPTTRTAGSSARPSSTRPTNSDMGLFGLALDGNPGTNHKLYVADMNGRILRLGPGQPPGRARGLLAGARRHGPRRRLDEVDVERPRLRQGRQPLRARRQAADLAGRPRTARRRSGSPIRG